MLTQSLAKRTKRLKLLHANKRGLNPLSRWDCQGLKYGPMLYTLCFYHNKSPFCSSLVLISLHCVSCSLFLLHSLAMCCSFWMPTAGIQLLNLYPLSHILKLCRSLMLTVVLCHQQAGYWQAVQVFKAMFSTDNFSDSKGMRVGMPFTGKPLLT